jgi:hypothetical protein
LESGVREIEWDGGHLELAWKGRKARTLFVSRVGNGVGRERYLHLDRTEQLVLIGNWISESGCGASALGRARALDRNWILGQGCKDLETQRWLFHGRGLSFQDTFYLHLGLKNRIYSWLPDAAAKLHASTKGRKTFLKLSHPISQTENHIETALLKRHASILLHWSRVA